MSEGHNFEQLRAHILSLSEAKEWEIAKKEWSLLTIHESDEQETCPCGHFPIREICCIRNHVTKQATEVGNICVKRFLGLNSHRIFAAIKRIRRDSSKSLNPDAIAYFKMKDLLTSWEYGFLQDTLKKTFAHAKATPYAHEDK